MGETRYISKNILLSRGRHPSGTSSNTLERTLGLYLTRIRRRPIRAALRLIPTAGSGLFGSAVIGVIISILPQATLSRMCMLRRKAGTLRLLSVGSEFRYRRRGRSKWL